MPTLFRRVDQEVVGIQRWLDRRNQVNAIADSVTDEQAVNMARYARMFPFMSPGVVRGLSQSNISPDDPAARFAVTQEMLRNYSTKGHWAGQLDVPVRETRYPTTSDPVPKTRTERRGRLADSFETTASTPANSPANREATMLRAQDLLKEGETLGVFDPTTQVLVEPEFGTGDKPSRAYQVFTRLQDTIYDLGGEPVPYLAADGAIRGYIPDVPTPAKIDVTTGEPLLRDRPIALPTGSMGDEFGRGRSGGYDDFGAAARKQTSSEIIAQIFANSEANQQTAKTREAARTNLQTQGVTNIDGPTALGIFQPTARAAFIGFDAPIQEIQGQVRNVYGALNGEDVDWLESQSDLGIILPRLARGQHVDVGNGFFVDPESEVARERRAREAERGQIGGHNVTIGRILASTVTEPDTTPFRIISGLADGAVQLADPTAYVLGKTAAIQDANKFFAAEDELLGSAGAFRGIRAHFHPPTFQQWANNNTKLIDTLAGMDDPYDIYKLTNGKLDPDLNNALSLTTDASEVRTVLDDAINRGRILTRTQLESTRTQRVTRAWTDAHRALNPSYSPRTIRIAKMMPNQTLDLDDPAQVARNLVRVMENAHATEGDIRPVYNMVARAETRNGLRNAVMESQTRVGGILERYGIRDPEIRSWLTRTNYDTANEDLRGLIDEVGADVPVWDTMAMDGTVTQIVGPHLPLEHISRFMGLPDQRAVRRLTTKFNFLTARQADIPVLTPLKMKAGKEVVRSPNIVGVPRLPIAAADFIMSEFLKPGWLMRLAWPIRVIGEEMLRITASGLDSPFRHPISYVATVIGGEQTRLVRMLDRMTPGVEPKLDISPNGAYFAETEELGKVTYRQHSGWLDEPGVIYSTRYTRYDKNNVDELADWRSSWAHELALLHHDPIAHMVANSNTDEAVEWLYAGAGRKFRRELMEAHPGNLESRAQIEAYIETVTDRISRMTGNHPDLIDIVKSGKFSKFTEGQEVVGDVFLDMPRINPQFTMHLRQYDDIGPDKIKGAMTVTARTNSDFMPRWNAGLDRMMSILMGTPTSTLSRAPAFKQFVWRRATELLPYANDEARDIILANARAAGLGKRQMKALENAATKGKKYAAPTQGGNIVDMAESPLDYGFGGVRRYAIYDEGASELTKHPYYADEPGLIGFIDYSPSFRRPGETYIHYMSVEPGHEGQGIAKRLVDHLYNSTDEKIDWGDIVSERAGALHKQFKELYPDKGNYGKNYYGDMPPKPPKPVNPTYAGVLNADDIDLLAKGYAIDDTKTLLYDLSERSQITDIMRILVPFGEAWKEVLTRWAKLATIQGPGGIPLPGKAVRRAQQVITGARGTDFGALMGAGEDPLTGKDRGFFYENEFGEEVYTYPGSEWLTSALTGVPVPLTGRVQGLNMFGNILPGLGPVAQIPAAWYLQDKPGYEWWREMLLPFGAPGAEETQDIFSIREYLPAYLKTAVDWIANSGDDRIYNSSVMYAATYLYSTGEYGDTTDEQTRLLEDAKDAARDLYKVRAFGQFILPSSPTFSWVTKSENGDLLNTRILAQEFYELQQEDYDTAVEKFLDMYGPDAIGAIVPHSRNIISAVPTSLEGAQWVAQHKDIRTKYNLVYGFFAPEGEFHYPTFARNYVTGARESISPREWLNLRDTMMGNYHFQRAKAMLGPDANSPNKEQSDWLRQQKANILEAYPNWNNEVGLGGRPTNEQMIAQLYDASKNSTLANTNAGKGLIEYLVLRDQANEQAKREGFVSFKTANDLAPTRQWLTDHAYRIIKQYPEFEKLWDVVFSREMEDATVEPRENR